MKSKQGFTLIELLVVIAIIGVLASITLSSLSAISSRAKDARFIAEVREFQKALEVYNIDNGTYPIAADANVISTYTTPWSYEPISASCNQPLVSFNTNWDSILVEMAPYFPTDAQDFSSDPERCMWYMRRHSYFQAPFQVPVCTHETEYEYLIRVLSPGPLDNLLPEDPQPPQGYGYCIYGK
jgi:prepilin-type N-terminal cleavage/methylation domain-containing protein